MKYTTSYPWVINSEADFRKSKYYNKSELTNNTATFYDPQFLLKPIKILENTVHNNITNKTVTEFRIVVEVYKFKGNTRPFILKRLFNKIFGKVTKMTEPVLRKVGTHVFGDGKVYNSIDKNKAEFNVDFIYLKQCFSGNLSDIMSTYSHKFNVYQSHHTYMENSCCVYTGGNLNYTKSPFNVRFDDVSLDGSGAHSVKFVYDNIDDVLAISNILESLYTIYEFGHRNKLTTTTTKELDINELKVVHQL